LRGLQFIQPRLNTEIANIVVMTMAESWMTKVSAVIVEFLLLVRVGFWSG
jgi:hypothetical protein